MTENHIKQNIYKRIELLFDCQNGKQLFQSMVDLQTEMLPELPTESAQSFVIYGIIKEFEDRQLDQLWFLHLIEQNYQNTTSAA